MLKRGDSFVLEHSYSCLTLHPSVFVYDGLKRERPLCLPFCDATEPYPKRYDFPANVPGTVSGTNMPKRVLDLVVV